MIIRGRPESASAPIIVFETGDVVFFEIAAGANLDNFQWNLPRIGQAMRYPDGNVGGGVFPQDEFFFSPLDQRRAFDYDPVLGPVVVLLAADARFRPYDQAFDLKTLGGHNAVDRAPGPINLAVPLGFRSLLLFQTGHQVLDILCPGAGADKDRVRRLNDDVLVHADGRHQAMPGMQKVFAVFGSGEPVTPEVMKDLFATGLMYNPEFATDELVAGMEEKLADIE